MRAAARQPTIAAHRLSGPLGFFLLLVFGAWLPALEARAAVPDAPAPYATETAAPLSRAIDVTQFTLANGLTLIVVPNHRVPAVTQMLWVKAGAADEADGKSGVAHFLEHLMFLGTDGTLPGAFAREILTMGGRHNALTSDDYTAFHETVPTADLARVMAMDADRFSHLKIDPTEMRRELQVILEERRMRVDNQPSALLAEQTGAALFLNHPYRLPAIGWEHEIRALTPADAEAFYRTWYAPGNAVLVVTGDVEPDAVRVLAERAYGGIPARAVPARQRRTEPPHLATVRLELRTDRVQTPSWRQTRLAPSYRAGWAGSGPERAYALEVAAQVLDGDATSPLYRTLVTEQKLASGIGVGYGGGRYDQSTLDFTASLRPGIAVPRFEAAFDTELAQAVESGFSDQAVDTAKRRMLEGQIFERDSLMGPAQAIGAALATGRSLEEWLAWPERIQAVTPAEAKAAILAVLAQPATTGVLLPATP